MTVQEQVISPAPRPIGWPDRSVVVSIGAVVAFVALWATVTGLEWISPLFLPSPSAVARAAGKLIVSGDLWRAVLASSIRVFAGFLLAAVVAIPLGISMAVFWSCLLYTSPSPRDRQKSRMPSSA